MVPLQGGAAIEVNDVPGVRIAGVLLQAGPRTSKALISIGHAPVPSGTAAAAAANSCDNASSSAAAAAAAAANGSGSSSACNPIVLSDVFARVGGPGVDPKSGMGPAVSTTVMMEINASNVVLDNVWLWRADVQNSGRVRDCNHSLVVNGQHVTACGLPSVFFCFCGWVRFVLTFM